jgi:hypothetical protein
MPKPSVEEEETEKGNLRKREAVPTLMLSLLIILIR